MSGPAGRNEAQLPSLGTSSKAAESSSFTGAAKALGLTQAAVSQRIHALEATLGKSSFQRRGGRVPLTEAGRKAYGGLRDRIDVSLGIGSAGGPAQASG